MHMRNSIFKENQLSFLSQLAIYALVGVVVLASFVNLIQGNVKNPYCFVIVLFGFTLFGIAKYSVISKGRKISFGTANMSQSMKNLYRLGYWLMLVGVVCIFAG